MGAYLSAPKTEKVSTDGKYKNFTYGVSSMQGWRVTQEDAHNCLPDFDPDKSVSLFAVYDGHGGAEVAKYCSENLPDFIKTLELYKDEKFGEALQESFLGFDEVLKQEEVIQELKVIAGIDDDSGDEDPTLMGTTETDMLVAEANMPIEELMAKYSGGPPLPQLQKLKREKHPSPVIKAKKKSDECENGDSNNSNIGADDPLRTRLDDKLENGQPDNDNNLNVEKELREAESKSAEKSSDKIQDSATENVNNNEDTVHSSLSDGKKETNTSVCKEETFENNEADSCTAGDSSNTVKQEEKDSAEQKSDAVVSSSTSSSSELQGSSSSSTSSKAVGSSDIASVESASSSSSGTPGPSVSGSSGSVGSSGTSEAGPDKSGAESSSSGTGTSGASGSGMSGPSGSGSSGPSGSGSSGPSGSGMSGPSGSGVQAGGSGLSNVKGKKTIIEEDFDSDDDSSEEEEDEEYDSEEMEEDDEDDDEDEDDEELGPGGIFGARAASGSGPEEEHNEEPGSDSGCTAVVALLKDDKLVVANAGDSRCVLCRDGTAVDLSVDHKPEDEPERSRIEAAGGKVTADGRVNGGLNLSRAIGDHFYKRNTDKLAKEQMISAFPDVDTATLGNTDEFLILACDGIWNFMTSQEVVDFVRLRLKDDEKRLKPSIICEELFDHCLAPNTMGDGTGCDNMTCIIVVLDNNISVKRNADALDTSVSDEQQPVKRAKVDQEEADSTHT